MLRPVGTQPPSVYWRRRLFVIGSFVLLLVLIVLTVQALTAGDGGSPAAGGTGASVTAPASTSPGTPQSSSAAASTSNSSSRSPSRSGTSAPPPARCVSGDLGVSAVVGKANYQVGDQPLLELQVTNNGAKPCVQDLADKQVELKVYNGESRVWGSHDCKIQPGADDMTLAVNTPVRVAITWSGLTSQPKCAGTRQRVGAGTYTLYALLSGKTGKATQFAIS